MEATNEQLFYKIELINKDLEVLRLKQNEFSEYIKKTEALSWKMNTLEANLQQLDGKLNSFEDKIDELCEKIDKSSIFNQNIITKVVDYIFKLFMVGAFIYAAMNGISLPGS